MENYDLPPEVAEKLGPYYVYALIDPSNDEIFYVGKGTGQRLMDHIDEDKEVESQKRKRIKKIHSQGKVVKHDIIQHKLEEEEALKIEAALIDCISGLTNKVRGRSEENSGRTSLQELKYKYGATPLSSDIPAAVLIRLGPVRRIEKDSILDSKVPNNRKRKIVGYHPDMSDDEIVMSTQAWWRISKDRIKRQDIQYAVAVYQGVTRAIMKIGDWEEREFEESNSIRRGFSAEIIKEGTIYEAYVGELGKRVETFRKGSQTPIYYWPRD